MFSYSSPINKAIGTSTPAGVFTTNSPLGTVRSTAHLCHDVAIGNVELVQPCTEPTRLCECKLVIVFTGVPPAENGQQGSTHSLLRKSSQNRTEDIKVPQVSYNPSSSPQGPISPKPSLYVVPLLNPMGLSVHFDQSSSKNAMRPVDSQHQKFHPCLGHAGWPLTLGGCREVIGS